MLSPRIYGPGTAGTLMPLMALITRKVGNAMELDIFHLFNLGAVFTQEAPSLSLSLNWSLQTRR